MRRHPHVKETPKAHIKNAVHLKLLVELLEHRKIIKSDEYCETDRGLHRFIKNKKPGLLTEGVIPLHDNVRTHVSRGYVELPSSSGTSLSTHPIARTCHPAIFMRLIP
ncbi:histone-lysine N-methyltransferase SETMAR [Trichonephila clavipes]|nr:histone-lysine N-methyltransferase SETMAR [Trichonephila clavipes]